MITLSIYSSLSAVGFLAAITAKLAARSISVKYTLIPMQQCPQAFYKNLYAHSRFGRLKTIHF
jgi:hypothetical protein